MVTIEEIFESYEIKRIFKLTSESDETIAYNMYEVEITYESERKELKKLFVESNTINIMSVDEETRKSFLIDRLFGKKGLINEQKRKDYIFLGKLSLDSKGKYETWRDYPLQDGSSALQKFESCLKGILGADFGIENTPNTISSMKSKNYAISDIHGMYGSYIEAIQHLRPQDNLYILGDVIDRGDNGIKILRDIIKRKQNPENNPSITFLVGNHEIMFLENVRRIFNCISEYIETHKENNDLNSDVKSKDIINVLTRNIKLNSLISELKLKVYDSKKSGKINESNELENQLANCLAEKVELDKKYKKIVEPLSLNPVYLDSLKIWILYNKGEKTLLDFCDLSKDERNEICNFLIESYIVLPEQVGEKNVLFVHAMPPNDDNMLRKMKEEWVGYTVKDLWTGDKYQMDLMNFMVEERDFETYEKSRLNGFFTICGHTPLIGQIVNSSEKGFVRIDAACGHGKRNKGACLALYCIDDGKVVKFIEEKEDISQKHNNEVAR